MVDHNTNEIGRHRLLIRRFSAEYLVSAEHPAPAALRARFDEAIERDLAQALASGIAPLMPEHDESVWLIRRLDVALDVNAMWEREQIARAVAARIVREQALAMRAGIHNVDVLWFPNRAAYLARFLVELAAGVAWGKWYYLEFDGLRMLPVSAALRTALCERPASGQRALSALPPTDLQRILKSLTAPDASRVLDAIAAIAASGDNRFCLETAWAAWRQEQAATGPHAALWLFLSAMRIDDRAGGEALKSGVRALLCFARHCRQENPDHVRRLLAALTEGSFSALYLVAGAADAELLTPLLHCDARWVAEVAEVMRDTAPSARDDTTTEPRFTSFGGAFLLLPLLAEMPIAEVASNWPPADEAAAVSLLRFLSLIKCLGRGNAERAWADPLLRDLLLIPPSLSTADISDWAARVSAAQSRQFLAALAEWQRERGTVMGETWMLARAATPGEPMAILSDGARGIWLDAAGWPRNSDRLTEALAQCEAESPVILCDPRFLSALRAALPEARVAAFSGEAARNLAEADPALAGQLARTGKLTDDLAYLSLPRRLGVPRAFDQALSVAAQGLMRNFAHRLAGFAGSHLTYLFHNFLDFPARVEEEAARRVVRMGRPPLHLILNMTGMPRQTYRLNWLDERPLALFQEE